MFLKVCFESVNPTLRIHNTQSREAGSQVEGQNFKTVLNEAQELTKPAD